MTYAEERSSIDDTARSVDAVRPHLYCFPAPTPESAYLAETAALWCRLGYTTHGLIESVSWHWLFGRGQRIVVLNWYEDYMLVNARPMALRLLRALVLLALVRIGARRIVWVRHNFRPLALGDGRAAAHAMLTRCLTLLADRVVTHRPVPGMRSLVVPHPLPHDGGAPEPPEPRDIDYLWFGKVRRYKALERLLAQWPSDVALRLLGRSDDAELTREIESIIRERGLNVRWDNRHVDDATLNATLRRTRCVVMAHAEHAMIVSGVFYHAIARGANVLIGDSAFARHVAQQYRFVRVFRAGELAPCLDTVQCVPADEVMREAQRVHGTEPCSAAWRAALDPV